MAPAPSEADRVLERDRGENGFDHHERRFAGAGPTPPEARVIHEVVREDGEKELDRSARAAAWSALGAGLSMGFSFLAMAILRSGLPDASWTKLVAGFGYTIGFLIVVLGRQQLYTESTLTAVLPLLTRRDGRSLWLLIRLWSVVLVANIVGTFAFAWLISRHGLFQPDVTNALRTLGAVAVRDTFWPMLTKAVLAGWLIALVVWLTPGAGQARLWLIVIITYVVAIGQFSHVIAGSVEAAYDVFVGTITLAQYATHFLLPTLIGNTLGGVSLVALLNHAPVREELAARHSKRRREEAARGGTGTTPAPLPAQ